MKKLLTTLAMIGIIKLTGCATIGNLEVQNAWTPSERGWFEGTHKKDYPIWFFNNYTSSKLNIYSWDGGRIVFSDTNGDKELDKIELINITNQDHFKKYVNFKVGQKIYNKIIKY